MLRSPTRPPAPRVKASSTSPFDTFFRFLRDQKPAVPRSADSTGCQELDTVPCFVRSTYDDCTRPTHPGPGEGDTAGKIATRHAAHPRVDPIDQASREFHPVRQAGNSIQERTVYVSLNKPSADRSVEKNVDLVFLEFREKKAITGNSFPCF